MKACESGNVDMVQHLISELHVEDVEGPDGLNALSVSIGLLDSALVLLTATNEAQIREPSFLCDIIHELDREIRGEKSDNKKDKMTSLRSTLVEHKIHQKFCSKPSCDNITVPQIHQK